MAIFHLNIMDYLHKYINLGKIMISEKDRKTILKSAKKYKAKRIILFELGSKEQI